ncbi:MAG: hypothetical protein HY644_03850 [Acidobacteria bacterium]|nr:hypothetical protein [Acidobacteriota bacterium]
MSVKRLSGERHVLSTKTQKGGQTMTEVSCAHQGCRCKVEQGKGVSRGGKTYCSEYCAEPRTGSGKCTCGHRDCS